MSARRTLFGGVLVCALVAAVVGSLARITLGIFGAPPDDAAAYVRDPTAITAATSSA